MLTETKEITRYNEGGRGRKQCAGCKQYVGNRITKCPCGSEEFVKANPEAGVIPTYDEPGKGLKQCPACQKYVGRRTQTCPCGHAFAKIDKEVATVAPVQAAKAPVAQPDEPKVKVMGGSRYLVWTPIGKCPFKLESTEEAAVIEWGRKVRDHYVNQGKSLAVAGLVYFSRQFYDCHSAEFLTVREHLEGAFA